MFSVFIENLPDNEGGLIFNYLCAVKYLLYSAFFCLVYFVTGIARLHAAETEEEKVAKFYQFVNIVLENQTVNPELAWAFVDSAIHQAYELKSSFYLGEAFSLKSKSFFDQWQLDSALYYSKSACQVFQYYPDSAEYFESEYNRGNILLAMGDHIQALVQFNKALRIVDENFNAYVVHDKEKIYLNKAFCYVSIGMVYLTLRDYEMAIVNFQKGLKLSDRKTTQQSLVLKTVAYNNLGVCYNELGDFDKAESFAITGLEIKTQLGIKTSTGYDYQVLAKSAYGRGKYVLCIKYLKKADEMFNASANKDELRVNDLLRAKCFYMQGEIDHALQLLHSLERAFDSPGRINERIETHTMLSEIYANTGNSVRALDYLRLADALKDDLLLKSNRSAVEEILNYFHDEEARIDDKLENYKHVQEKQKLQTDISLEKEKRQWLYALFFISTICLILIIIVIARGNRRNKKINQELNYSIDEKQVLFREVHHRVKNNFQIISSLLNLQQGIEEDERSKQVLTDAQGRIQSMSLVHEMLYRKNEAKKIDFCAYTHELVSSILSSFKDEKTMIECKIDCGHEYFDLELAVPLGLILNEALTNAVKYAFKNKTSGIIQVSISPLDGKNYLIVVKDNGWGIPDEFLNGGKETLGIELIRILSNQLGGEANFIIDKGTELQVKFEV